MRRLGGRTARNAEPVDPAIGTTHMCQCIVECGLLTGTRSAEGIMASGHANRANRPNTWLHRPATRREVLTCQPGAVHTWHLADVQSALMNVRFEGINGHDDADVMQCLLMTHSGHARLYVGKLLRERHRTRRCAS